MAYMLGSRIGPWPLDLAVLQSVQLAPRIRAEAVARGLARMSGPPVCDTELAAALCEAWPWP